MNVITNKSAKLKVNAYIGDAKTLLAFNLSETNAKNLAGFTIQVQPPGGEAYYLQNQLQFEKPSKHAQDPKLPANSSFNAPIHKFRWLHVPGSVHQGLKPPFGTYTYTVTPRYFDDASSMKPIDAALAVSVKVPVKPFEKGKLALGFTRGFVQSQAFVHHFGPKAQIQPAKKALIFDTTAVAGKNAKGETYTFDDEYEWLGFTAQDRIFEILDEVIADKSLRLDVFAYDLSEPNFAAALLTLAKQGRVRVVLDNAALHTSTETKTTPEDAFEKLFRKADKDSILRGHFSRYAHDKVLIVSDKNVEGAKGARKVLTGSTNYSVTGLYVNSNHVIVFDDRKVAQAYAAVFELVWATDAKNAAFRDSPLAGQTFSFGSTTVPATDITFSPHTETFADKLLGSLVARVAAEGKKPDGNVMFAVMELGKGSSVVYEALNTLHAKQKVFSFGISDNPRGIFLYVPGETRGLLVTGKPVRARLPPPFDQVPNVGLGHQIHHKFVVCGFNSDDAVVYCGSSNLANLGEQVNGDNLLAIHDKDVATAFAIEAVGLVDHFNFLDRYQDKAKAAKGTKTKKPPASLKEAAVAARWFLSTTDHWTGPYFDSKDLHFADRQLFG